MAQLDRIVYAVVDEAEDLGSLVDSSGNDTAMYSLFRDPRNKHIMDAGEGFIIRRADGARRGDAKVRGDGAGLLGDAAVAGARHSEAAGTWGTEL